MSVEVLESAVRITDKVQIEALDELVQAVDTYLDQGHKEVRVDLSECLHLHTGAVQLLMKRRARVIAWPPPSEWTEWLRAGLGQ